MVRDSVQLETAINTISHEYLLDFTSEYDIPEMLHLELPGPGDRIVDFPEGKVGVYTRIFEFANFRLPLSQFLFDVLGYYQIHLSQLSVIGAAKVSHFKINCRVLNIIPTLSLFRVFYTPSFNSGWMSFSKRLGKNTPQCYTKPLDSLKNWNNRFFWVDERVFPTVVDWRTNAPKDGMPITGMYSAEAVRALDTHHMDLFNLIRTPNPTKVKVGSRPRAPHKVPLLTLTANRVIEMNDPATATDSSGVPANMESHCSETQPGWSCCGRSSCGHKEPKKRPRWDRRQCSPKSLRRDHADPRPSGSSHGGKSLAAIQLGLTSTASMPEDAPIGVSDPDPLCFADPLARPSADVAVPEYPCIAAARDPESENASSPTEVGSPGGVYRPEWGVTNGSLIDTPEACQDLVDHVAPSGYFSKLRHMHNEDFLGQYNVARQDKRIQAQELEIKNLKVLLETEADMKKAAEDKSAGLMKELKDMHARFLDLQVSHEHLSQQVASLKEQASREEKLKAVFEEFKRYEDDRVERRCAELDAHLDALSIDFDEELYPHMLTAIAGRRWVIGHGLRLAAMKCGESLDMRQAFADVVSAGIAKEAKFVAALQALKDLKYPLLDQLEGLKDAPIDVIMAALYLESDTGEDAPQCIRDLRPSSSQLTIPVYPKVRDPRNPWAYKEEIVLADAITANISRAEKKKKCRIVCRTHEVGSAHHARSDGVPISAPTVVPQGLALLLANAATQTK
nr:hypothetical protein [Tanacetum cinerariifolium]